MKHEVDLKVAVVVPNWNGKNALGGCLDSLLAQTAKPTIIVVENGSTDGSLEFVQTEYPEVELVVHKKNRGFAAGVNAGIRSAITKGCEYVALFNNDAVADKDWLKNLLTALEEHETYGIAACKLVGTNGELDSTGEYYSVWGLPFPRGRGEGNLAKYDNQTEIFGASGGASLYRIKMLEEIGLFDEDFFAYYEDVDLSFRAQLAGWKICYVPSATASHEIGATGGRIKGFTTYQTFKNLPWLLWKNVPTRYLWRVLPRFKLAYFLFLASSIARGQGWPAFKGLAASLLLMPKKLAGRGKIQRRKKVPSSYVWGIMAHDLPPKAGQLRRLRNNWWKLRGKTS